jgi:hypothetical protein
MRRRRGYEPIGVAHIGTLLAEAIGDEDRVREALGVWPAWEEAVGPQIARASRPVSLRHGVLTVHVRHAVWLQELTAMQTTLLRQVRRVAAGNVVRELRFRVAPFTAAERPEVRTATIVPAPSTIPYAVARAIRTVGSPRLRGVMLRVAARWAALAAPPPLPSPSPSPRDGESG